MTNEEFIKKMYNIRTPNLYMIEHAKKLVAVAEAAKQFIEDDIPDNPSSTGDLRRALKELQGGEE